jgi:hypothetical protein
VDGQILGDLLAHEDGGLLGPLLPREDAGRQRAVEAVRVQFAEEFAEVDLALADVEVLVDPGRGAGRIEDVAVARVGRVVEGVGEVDMGEEVARVLDDAGGVVADVEGVRGTWSLARMPRRSHRGGGTSRWRGRFREGRVQSVPP